MIVVDKRPTMAEWPVRIWAMEEIPEIFDLEARKSMKGTFNQYHMVYSPICRTAPDSFEYMFGYGKEEIFYLRNEKNEVRKTVLKFSQIEEIYTQRELLNAKIIVKYKADLQDRELATLEFPYIPSVYYLYDPFLNRMLGLDQEFVLAARTLGVSNRDILFKEILPNSLGQIIITFMFSIPNAIFLEAFLAFVGLGVPAPMASLGSLINDGYKSAMTYPHMVAAPVIVLGVLMLGFNLFADGLRDAIDPQLKQM